MSDHTNIPPKVTCHRDAAAAVAKTLRDAGHVAYFAGGCVRDMLMGLEPKDYDVATDAPPAKVRSLFRNTQAVGAAFGVILVRVNDSVIEVATFRADGEYLDGRRPSEVRFTNAEEDAKRRDFTINGLFMDPATHQVLDYVDGQRDIQARVLRAIGDPAARFDEDYLRMLRAVRFASRFNLSIDPPTAAAIGKHAGKLAQISPERIAEELRKVLTSSVRGSARQLLSQLRLLPVIFRQFPEAFDLTNAGNWFDRLETEHFGTALAMLTLDYRSQHRSLAELLIDTEINRAAAICRTLLKISNDESDAFTGSISFSQLLQPLPPSVAVMKRFLATPYSSEARRVMLVLGGSGIESERIDWLEAQFASFPPDTIAPPPLVTGDDLIEQGLKPGKLFKTILDQVYDLQLEGKVCSKENAMVEALARAKS